MFQHICTCKKCTEERCNEIGRWMLPRLDKPVSKTKCLRPKKLSWSVNHDARLITLVDDFDGFYAEIVFGNDLYFPTVNGFSVGSFESEEKAKAAVQEEFESHVMSLCEVI